MSQSNKGERNAKKVFASTASFNRQDRGGDGNKGKSKHTVLDVSKVLKEKNSKGQSAKFRKLFAEENDPTIKQQKIAAISKARGNVIQDMRNLDATEAELKHTLYKQKQQQMKNKKAASGKYALAEGNSELGQSMSGEVLTHGGKAIDSMTAQDFRSYDRMRDESDDENDRKAIGRHETGAHFGGGDLDAKQYQLTRLSKEEWEKLSLPERYRFLIQMSKQRKADQKGRKARDDAQLSGLDADYKDILSMLDFSRGDDDSDEEIETKLSIADGLSGQSKEDYLQGLFDKYNISTADNQDGEDEDDFDEDGEDEDDDEDGEDDEDDEDEDDDDEIADSDDDEVAAAKIDSKFAKLTPSAASTTTPNTPLIPAFVHIDDDNEDQRWAKAFGQTVLAPKIGLDGKAIGSDQMKLSSGLRIGSNAGRDEYLAQTLTLKQTARAQATDRLVSDQEKATRHRNYLLFLEERRLKRKSGDYDAEMEDQLEQQYESLFMGRRALKKQAEKAEDELIVTAMMDGEEDDDELDVSTGLRVRKSNSDDDDEDDEDEDDYDEDDFDEDDYDEDDDDDEEEETPKKSKKSTKPHRSGDTLDEDFLLDDDVGGIDYDDYDDEEIETMDVGGETTTLTGTSEGKRGRYGKLAKTKKDWERREAQTRLARKAEMGMFVNDVDGVLQRYYLSTENNDYRLFIAKIKVTIRDEIPYNYEFPNTFSEFISMVYTHLKPILAVYQTEAKGIKKIVEKIQKDEKDSVIPPTTTFAHLTESSLRGHVLSLILGRIFQLFHPRISASNEARIEHLYRFLWRLLKVVIQQQEYLQKDQKSPSEPLLSPPPNKAYIVETINDVMAIADVITSYIFTINELLPRHTGRACIGLMELFAHANKSPSPGQVLITPDSEREVIINTEKFGQRIVIVPPQVHELFAYKLLMQLYPLSDSRHTIMTPLQLLLSQSITQCYIANNNDLVRMVFLMGLLFEIWRASEKYIPEIIAALQSLIALLSNSFIPNSMLTKAKQQYYNENVIDNEQQAKQQQQQNTQPTKGKKAAATAAATPAVTTPFQWNPIMLESWRECHCDVAPGTLNTLTTLAEELKRRNERSTGLLPLQWLTNSPLITQQSQTEYFRFAMVTTLTSFISSVNTHVKGMTACNEVLQPLITSLQALVINMGQFIEIVSATPQPQQQQTTKPTTKDTKKGKKAQEDNVSLINPNTHNITQYTTLLTQLSGVLATSKQIANNSLVNRKPLEKYAAVIVPKELEPRLDFETKFNPTSKKNNIKDEVSERKRLQKQLASQQKTMRKEIKANAFNNVLEQQKINAARDEARKARLTRARQIVQKDLSQDLQNRKNFKKVKR